MSQILLLGSHRIYEKYADEFAKRVSFHAKNCVAKEPGCIHFSVSKDSTGRWHYVEVYGSQADLDTHVASEHFLKHIAGVKHMLVGEADVTTAEIVEYASK